MVSNSRLCSVEEDGMQEREKTVNTHQSAKEAVRETEAEKEERACVCLAWERGGRGVGGEGAAQEAPRPCSLNTGPFPVHLTADSPHSGKGRALGTGEFEPESRVWHFLAGGP